MFLPQRRVTNSRRSTPYVLTLSLTDAPRYVGLDTLVPEVPKMRESSVIHNTKNATECFVKVEGRAKHTQGTNNSTENGVYTGATAVYRPQIIGATSPSPEIAIIIGMNRWRYRV